MEANDDAILFECWTIVLSHSHRISLSGKFSFSLIFVLCYTRSELLLFKLSNGPRPRLCSDPVTHRKSSIPSRTRTSDGWMKALKCTRPVKVSIPAFLGAYFCSRFMWMPDLSLALHPQIHVHVRVICKQESPSNVHVANLLLIIDNFKPYRKDKVVTWRSLDVIWRHRWTLSRPTCPRLFAHFL